MAYVDHAFSISDEDLMIGTSYTVSNRPPVKEISLAVSLLLFGILGIVSGFFMAYNRVGGDRGHESMHLGGDLSSVAAGDVVAACLEAFWMGSSLRPYLRVAFNCHIMDPFSILGDGHLALEFERSVCLRFVYLR
ncbi:unnamed protein product [Brassica oleracea]|uniref:(rape) hypothetical protein n=1 Tax=Brassica napus TaxID=3708 RepID=A0A816LDP5_BRANA|nr:unnamed protein product [Brassica napus]